MTAMSYSNHLERLDSRQREAALETKNCVVTAGAGAGKTTVLAARYIQLAVERRIPVSEILALTFTRKAAAEMFERIYSELAKVPGDWAERQKKDFANARITTIDSFCSEIVRQSARDYGYTPDFAIDPETCSDLAATLAARYLYEHRTDPGIKEALDSFPYSLVESALLADAGRAFATPSMLLSPFFEPMIDKLARFASDSQLKMRTALKSGARRIAALANSNSYADARAINVGADCAQAMALAEALLDHDLAEPEELRAIANLRLVSYGRNETEKAIKDLAKDLRKNASDLLALEEHQAHREAHDALLRHLEAFARELSEAKRRADIMDYKDLGACAVETLIRRTDLRERWKRNIRNIVVDEFQDNNSLQRDLVYLLAEKSGLRSPEVPQPSDLEPEKLFFVGDEKQSIYRFRGADVSVFRLLAEELGRELSLAVNYRSSESLVAFFNDFFPRCFELPDSEIILAPGHHARFEAMECAASSQGHPSQGQKPFPSRIEYHRLSQGEEIPNLGDPDEILSGKIAEFITISRANLKVRRDGGRPARWSDFAILLRTTTHQNLLEKALRRRGIPIESESPRNLTLESPASDIHALLSLAMDPEDKAAYAICLRSPACGVTDDTFARLLKDETMSLESIPAADRERLARLGKTIEELRELAKTGTISEIVLQAWQYGGLRLDLLSNPESRAFIEHFDFLFHLAASFDSARKSLADFIHALGEKIGTPGESFEIENVPRDSREGVRILTIHKAKGLQFPIVILPWVESSGSTQRSQDLWHQLPDGLVFDLKPHDVPGAKKVNIFFELAKDLEKEKSVAEIKRLLYVACTRAEDHLFFFGRARSRNAAKGTSFAGYLDEYQGKQLERFELPATPSARLSPEAGNIPDFDRMQQVYAKASILERCGKRREFPATMLSEAAVIQVPRLSDQPEETTPELPIPADTFGTLCHEAVEYAIINRGTSGFAPEIDPEGAFPAKALEAAVRIAIAYAKGFLSSPIAEELYTAPDLATEKAFLFSIGDLLVSGRLDLWAEDERAATIIDFKSDAQTDSGRYTLQMALYKLAAGYWTGGKETRIGIYWLRAGRMEWLKNLPGEEEILKALPSIVDRLTSRGYTPA